MPLCVPQSGHWYWTNVCCIVCVIKQQTILLPDFLADVPQAGRQRDLIKLNWQKCVHVFDSNNMFHFSKSQYITLNSRKTFEAEDTYLLSM